MDIARPTTDNFVIRHATAIAIGTVTVLMLLAALAFWLLGIETKGRTIQEIGHGLDMPAPSRVPVVE